MQTMKIQTGMFDLSGKSISSISIVVSSSFRCKIDIEWYTKEAAGDTKYINISL